MHKRYGFSLVELLVTISVIMILATFSLAKFTRPDPQKEFDQSMQTVLSQFELARSYARSIKQCCSDAQFSRPPYPDAGYALKFYFATDENPSANQSYQFYADADTPEEYYNSKKNENTNSNCPPEGCQCPPEGCPCGPDGCPTPEEPYTGKPFAYEEGGFDQMFYEGTLPDPLELSDCQAFGFSIKDFYNLGFIDPECQVYMYRRPVQGFGLNDFGGGPIYIDLVFQHKEHPEIKGTIRVYNMITTIEKFDGVPPIPFEQNPYQTALDMFTDFKNQGGSSTGGNQNPTPDPNLDPTI